MVQRLSFLLLLVAACLIMSGCRAGRSQRPGSYGTHYTPPDTLPAVTPQPAIAASNTFGFNLLHELTGKRENVFISPTSLMLALAMTYNGAGGETKAEMAKALQVQNISMDDLNEQLASLQKGLQKADSKVQVEIANSLWANRGYTFKSPFMKVCQEQYGATLDALDFNNPEALKTINGWANEKTHSLIPEVVTQQDLAQAALLLMDAVYFEGEWSTPFEKTDTHQQDFVLPNGKTKPVQMMACHDDYIYADDEKLQAIALPYGTGRFAMIVVLPREKQALPTLLKATDNRAWQSLLGRMAKRVGTIKLPRFEIAYEAYLNDALMALGMTTVFQRADFSLMADSIPYLAFVKHKSFLQVTEKKTKAAAVTVAAPGMASLPINTTPFEMIVDHPFLLGIVDTQTGATLFLGAIEKPKETRAED